MIDICNGCPRFGKVCDGKTSLNKKFCFSNFDDSDVHCYQHDTLSKLVDDVVKSKNRSMKIYKPECCELTKHCTDDFFLLKLKPVEKGVDLVGVGFVKVRGGK